MRTLLAASLAALVTARLTISFYIPSPAKPMLPPTVVSAEQLLNSCQAGAVRIVVTDRERPRSVARKRELESALTALFPPGTAVGPWHGFGGIAERDGSYRHTDSLTVATSIDSGQVFNGRTPDGIDTIYTVIVAITTPRSHPPISNLRDNEGADAERRMTNRLREAFRIAATGGETGSAIRSLLDSMHADAEPGTPAMDRFVNTLQQWIKASRSLPPTRRAAALLIADALLARKVEWFMADSNGNVLHDRLTAVGASLTIQRGDDEGSGPALYVHNRNWLLQSAGAAPGSRGSELAFLMLAEPGFRAAGSCDTMYRAVITRVTDYLHRFPASPVRGELHLLLGAAWGDVVAFAQPSP
jgi:hypothetical protein